MLREVEHQLKKEKSKYKWKREAGVVEPLTSKPT